MSTRAFQGGAFQFGPGEAFQSRQDETGSAALGVRAGFTGAFGASLGTNVGFAGDGYITSRVTYIFAVRTTLSAFGGQTYYNVASFGLTTSAAGNVSQTHRPATSFGATTNITATARRATTATVTLATQENISTTAGRTAKSVASLGVRAGLSAQATAARLGVWSVSLAAGHTFAARKAVQGSAALAAVPAFNVRQRFIAPQVLRRQPRRYFYFTLMKAGGGDSKKGHRAIEPRRKLPTFKDVFDRPRVVTIPAPELIRKTKRDLRPLPTIDLRQRNTMGVQRDLQHAFEAKNAQELFDQMMQQEQREAEGQRALELLDTL